MKIKSIDISNFRLLEKIENLELDENHTIIVGRNNTGKTSLTELFKKFFKEGSKFNFNDFSINTYVDFKKSLDLYNDYYNEKDDNNKDLNYKLFLDTLPEIELKITFIVDDEDTGLEYVGNLEDESNDYVILLKLSLKNNLKFFEKIRKIYGEDKKFNIINYFKNNFEGNFEIRKFLIDQSGKQYVLNQDITNIFKVNFIDAQRDLDDNSTDHNYTLSKVFENYFKKNNDGSSEKELEDLLLNINSSLDNKYVNFFKELQKDLTTFGYPGLTDKDRKLLLKSELCSSDVFKGNNSKIYYSSGEYCLPESYNGLGYSNLIYIILQVSYLYQEFIKLKPKPQFQLLFIEEPEAHLHPQMQQTFIKQIEEFIKTKGWNVQIVLTTHSSHIITYSDFTKIRYFRKNINYQTTFNDLRKFQDNTENIEFLKKYLTIDRSDIFFADKLILIEGMVERLLLPLFIKKVDEEIQETCNKLSSQYVSIIEVGGAYSHKFKNFLEFIGIKTLIITDLDSTKEEIKLDTNGQKTTTNIACKVFEGTKTSNFTLRNWIPGKENISELITLQEEKKVVGNYRIAYQLEENGDTGRSFEDSFILANFEILENYGKDSSILKKIFSKLTKEEIKINLRDIAKKLGKNNEKTNFAFDIIMMDSFNVPKYIKEGLVWLSNNNE